MLSLLPLKRCAVCPRHNGQAVLKVGIVGEIYVLLEPASNLEMEETLGNLGVEVERSMFLTGWTRDNTWNDTTRTDDSNRGCSPLLAGIGWRAWS